jgi:hypothetical protein
VATHRLARLSRLQWENSARDLLQLADIRDVTGPVTGDALVGFDTEAEALRIGEQLRADLEKASRAFTAGAKAFLVAMLQSPHFLYRTELSSASSSGPLPLTRRGRNHDLRHAVA